MAPTQREGTLISMVEEQFLLLVSKHFLTLCAFCGAAPCQTQMSVRVCVACTPCLQLPATCAKRSWFPCQAMIWKFLYKYTYLAKELMEGKDYTNNFAQGSGTVLMISMSPPKSLQESCRDSKSVHASWSRVG